MTLPQSVSCKNGHDFTPENTYTRPKNGKRSCRICLRENAQSWRRNHPGYYVKYQADWYQKNRDTVDTHKREWVQDNLEKERTRKRNWAKENPEPCRKASRKRRALKKAQLGLWSQFEEQIVRLLRVTQEEACFYCKVKISSDLSPQDPNREILEHPLPLSRGGVHGIENWVLSCFSCNSRKGNKTAIEFGDLNEQRSTCS